MATDRPTLTVVVPMTPPRELSPNARVHWRRRAAAARAARQAAWAATHAALDGPGQAALCGTPRPLAVAIIVGLGKGQRRADLDNTIASCKAYCDGMCDALDVDDRQIRSVALAWARDETGTGYTRLTVTETTEGAP